MAVPQKLSLFFCGLRSAFALSFHLGLGGFDALGASFRTLFALLVKDLLSAEQLDENLLAAVALAPSGVDDAQVSALAVAKTGSDLVEEALDRFAGHEIGAGLTFSMRVAALAEGNH